MAIPLSEWREQEAQADKMRRAVKLAAAAVCIIGAASYWQDIASAVSALKPGAAQEVNTAPASNHRLNVGAPQIKAVPAVKTKAAEALKPIADGTLRIGGPIGKLNDVSRNTSVSAINMAADSMVSSNMGFHRNSKAYKANPKLDYALMTDPGAQKAVATMISTTYKVSYSIAELSVKESVKSAKKHQIEPTLLLALMGQESSFNKKAKSNYGAEGLMQVVPRWHEKTMRKVGVTDILEAPVGKQIELGTVVLKEFLGPGKLKPVEVALQHYNQGANATIDPNWKYSNGVLSKRNALKVVLTQYVQENAPTYASLNSNL